MNSFCPVCNNPIEAGVRVCPSCGFKLLEATQRFSPIEISEQSRSFVAAPPATASLHVVRGPQTGVSYQLGTEPLLVGRSPKCPIFLNDMTVSREHAVVAPDGDGFAITDSHSFNGVWVNNETVERHHLRDGDIIQVGVFCLLFKEEAAR